MKHQRWWIASIFVILASLLLFPISSFGAAQEQIEGWAWLKKTITDFFEHTPKTDTPEDLYNEVRKRWNPDPNVDYKKLVRWIEVYDQTGKINSGRKIIIAIFEDTSFDSKMRPLRVHSAITGRDARGVSFCRELSEAGGWGTGTGGEAMADLRSRLSPPSVDSGGRGVLLSPEEKEVVLKIITNIFGRASKYQAADLREETAYSKVHDIFSNEVWGKIQGFSNIFIIYDKDENPKMIQQYGIMWQ
jgi:hypothetical protein